MIIKETQYRENVASFVIHELERKNLLKVSLSSKLHQTVYKQVGL